MAIQFLLVTFADARPVLADGAGVGFTNHILMLPGDEYEITLGGSGYSPASQNIALAGTSMIKPMVIGFSPLTPLTPLPSLSPESAVKPVAAVASPKPAKPDPKAKKNA